MKKPLQFTLKFLAVFFRILFMTTPIWGVMFLSIIVVSWLFARIEQISFCAAVYFAGVTALTIGYGDIVPHTAMGKGLCLLMGILGVITTGIIVAIALQAIKITYETLLVKPDNSQAKGNPQTLR
ncbi:MAG: two pore domain potassium channel family protein [Spartobacteria bacterium]|nr:two pore domain potassium channel family protein [Spartobacteria bacterium]